MVPLVAVVGVVVVVRGMTERAPLVASENPGGDESSGWPGSTLAGGTENIGAVDEFNAGHVGHGLGGGGQGGGCGTGGDRATCFAGALLPLVVWSGAIKNLSGPLSRRQTAPSLPKVDVGEFCPGDRWEVRFFFRYFNSLVA